MASFTRFSPPDVEPVRIEGYFEILALHKMLMEYKFDDLENSYAGSPFIAAIQNRLADALEAADPGQGWRKWREAEGHPHRVEAVRRHLAKAGKWWQECDHEERIAHVRNVLAPLRPSDELLAELTAIGATVTASQGDSNTQPSDL
jgi:hypothetical protein